MKTDKLLIKKEFLWTMLFFVVGNCSYHTYSQPPIAKKEPSSGCQQNVLFMLEKRGSQANSHDPYRLTVYIDKKFEVYERWDDREVTVKSIFKNNTNTFSHLISKIESSEIFSPQFRNEIGNDLFYWFISDCHQRETKTRKVPIGTPFAEDIRHWFIQEQAKLGVHLDFN